MPFGGIWRIHRGQQRSADEPMAEGWQLTPDRTGLLEAFGDGAPPTGTESMARPFSRQDADYEAV
jgi:hypothetical protein